MLLAYVVIRPIKATLQRSPYALDAVRMHLTAHILEAMMVDEAMTITIFWHGLIAPIRIREHWTLGFNMLLDKGDELCPARRFYDLSNNSAAALFHADNGRMDNEVFTFRALVEMFIPFLPIYVRFIHLNDTTQFFCFLACFANALRHKPCRLLGRPERFSKLNRWDALARCSHEEHRKQPCANGNMTTFHNRSGLAGELPQAWAALIGLRSGDIINLVRFAIRTEDFAAPPPFNEKNFGGLFRREPLGKKFDNAYLVLFAVLHTFNILCLLVLSSTWKDYLWITLIPHKTWMEPAWHRICTMWIDE